LERLNIPKVNIGGVNIDKLSLFLDEDKNLIVLPFLWSLHMCSTGTVYKWIKVGSHSKYQNKKPSTSQQTLEILSVSNNTISNYLGHIFKFLRYIDKSNKETNTPSVHRTELLNSAFINNYLNNELPKTLRSTNSLNAHQAAINAYLTFLFEMEIRGVIPITLHRTTRQKMAEADTRSKKINYVSKSERSQLLKACNNHRDKLILRLGYEVGLRTSELCGLLLRKKDEKLKPSRKGLLSLFFELDKKSTQMSFQYLLDGKYTKRGKSRFIYFSRELLEAMKQYSENERLIVENQSGFITDAFLLRLDRIGFGLPVGKKQGTNTFADLRKLFPYINETLSYHDLRHTFATELYHSELLDPAGQETRSESAALIAVSERLGHADTKTTQKYIRLRMQMLMIEGINHD